MATTVTVNSTTKLWTTTGAGIISYPSSANASSGGPYDVVPVTVPFDPGHKTGGSFWQLMTGPNSGSLLSAWTNTLGYGSITISYPVGAVTSYVAGNAHVNPLADWRILIKGMGGATGVPGKNLLTFNSTTMIWSRTGTGIIKYPNVLSATAAGPFWVNPIVVPFDPVHQTGGSFWELKEGPNAGWLVSFHSNDLSYGDITVSQHDGFDRGPGATLATIYRPEAHLAGASLHYNQPGEMHFTLLVDDPNIGVPIPKQTHYAIEFYDSDAAAWVEIFAGLIWDFDATDTEVVFYGIDYLALYQYVIDERFNPRKPTQAAPTGSFYVKKTIQEVITAHLTYSQQIDNSIVGFIAVGDIAVMPEKVSVYSTFMDTLTFVLGLINSSKAGSGRQTRLCVRKLSGTYTVMVEGDPGEYRDTLLLQYGDLVQGYHVIPFGTTWASRVNLIARSKDGLKVLYESNSSAVDQGVYGRIGQPAVFVDGVDTTNGEDLNRRTAQAAADAARIGRQISVGAKLGSLRPLEGYDICDSVPIQIDHGAVHTQNWGSDAFAMDPSGDPSGTQAAYWAIIGLTWESYDDGHWMTSPILWPRGGGKPYVPRGTMRFFGSTYGGFGSIHTIAASDDGVTWHVVLTSEQLITLNGVMAVDPMTDGIPIPAAETLHEYWSLHYYDWAYGYNGGCDMYELHLYDEEGFDLFWKRRWTITGDSDHYNDTPPYFSPRGGSPFGAYAGVYSGYQRSIRWAVKLDGHGLLRTPKGSGYGPPDPPNGLNVLEYTNLATGEVWIWDDSTSTWGLEGGSGHTASGLYDFTFAAATTWVITHTLNSYPRVTIMDAGGNVIQAAVVYDTASQITVSFFSNNAPFAVAGSAHLGG